MTPEQYKTCMDRVAEDTSVLALRDLTLDLCESNILPAIATPRSLDLTLERHSGFMRPNQSNAS